MRYEPEAIYITPPTGIDTLDEAGAIDRCAGRSVAFTLTSSSPTLIVAPGGWVTFTADQDVQIRFWKDNTLPANAASDFPVWKNAYVNLVCDGFLWIRVKGVSSTGTLYYYASNR